MTLHRFAAILSVMPRAPRAFVAGIRYHVMNRGNGRRAVFHKDTDYQAFLKAIGHACIEIPILDSQSPGCQGSRLMRRLEAALLELGCLKVRHR